MPPAALTNHDMRAALPGYAPRRPRRYGIAAAVLVSLLLHGLFLYGYRFSTPAPQLADVKKVESLTVWIRPLPKLRLVTPPAPSPAVALRPTPAPRPLREASRPAREALRETPPVPAASFTMAPTPPPAAQNPTTENAPKFDMEAMRRSARQIATTPDPARAGMAVAQIPEKPIASESQLARTIQSGSRANCKDGIPGGLLAPLILLMDKKDSGCKW